MSDSTLSAEELAGILLMLAQNLAAIRRLNDDLRVHGRGGSVVITPGIAGLGPFRIKRVFDAIRAFNSFSAENDPWHEHDCALQEVDGIKVIWQIAYYDCRRRFLSPDPADPAVTIRVMTVMRADEW